MPDYGLSVQQLAVICALSSGATMNVAADQAGVHRNTIANWRRNSLPFQQGFAHAQYDRALYYREKVEDLIDLAIQSLHDILSDPKAPPSVKLKAALAVITTASMPPAPKKQVELDIEKIVIQKTAQTVTEDQFEPTPPVHNDAQPAPLPTTHNDAQPGGEIAVNPPSSKASAPPELDAAAHNDAQAPKSRPGVARNTKCPCGSGRKYKRCCLDSSMPPRLATAA
jgi:hypothetical protein